MKIHGDKKANCLSSLKKKLYMFIKENVGKSEKWENGKQEPHKPNLITITLSFSEN